MMAEPKLVLPTMDAIQRWQGVAVPNAAARHGLADFEALIADLAKLRGEMAFEEEPAGFEAALRDCRDPEA
jgi:hypothetical protein